MGISVRADVQAARVVARDLTLGDVPDGPGAEKVGGALGFMQLAERDELTDALLEAGQGCETCHRSVGLIPPEPPPWRHEDGVAVVADALAWGRTPIVGPPVRSGDVASVLTSCVECHGPDATERPGSP